MWRILADAAVSLYASSTFGYEYGTGITDAIAVIAHTNGNFTQLVDCTINYSHAQLQYLSAKQCGQNNQQLCMQNSQADPEP